MTATPKLIFKICAADEWEEALKAGEYRGSAVDLADGYIHFSAKGQLAETAARHFKGRAGLVLVAVAADAVKGALKWEPSRGGNLFPHLCAALPTAAAQWTKPLPLGADGTHRFPAEVALAD